MPKIAIHEPMPMSAVSYYRSIGVFSYLHKLNHNIQTSTLDTVSWDQLAGIDIFYMERPQQDSAKRAFTMAKDFNVPVWVDFDDNLFGVPEYNPAHDFYKKTNALENIKEIISQANIVTVSTPAIKEAYSQFNKNIHVIENAHNDYQYPFIKRTETINTINWRGSNTHRNDLLSVAEDLFSSASKFSEWAWTFIGNDVWFITDHIKKAFNLKMANII